MKRQKIGVFVCTAITLFSFAPKAFACGCSGRGPAGSGPSLKYVTPNIHPSPMPPGFPYKWSGKDLIKRFSESGLEIEKAESVVEANHSNLAVKANEMTRFSIPSFGENIEGFILCFQQKNDLEKAKKYYLELNEKGELYTWSFVKDNIVLVLTGTITEEKARQYEKILYELKE